MSSSKISLQLVVQWLHKHRSEMEAKSIMADTIVFGVPETQRLVVFRFFRSPLRRCWTHQLGCDLGYFGHYMLERPHHMGDVLPSPGASIAYVYIQCLCIFDYP